MSNNIVGVAKVCVGMFVFVLLLMMIMNSVANYENGNETESVIAPPVYKWAVWDGESEVPNAKIIIRNGEATRNQYIAEYGSIHGAAKNLTGEKLNYIQITYGIYSENGTKLGSCLANENSISNNTVWEFDAQCLNLPHSAFRYKVEDVTYW